MDTAGVQASDVLLNPQTLPSEVTENHSFSTFVELCPVSERPDGSWPVSHRLPSLAVAVSGAQGKTDFVVMKRGF